MSPVSDLLRRVRGSRAKELERQVEEELRAHLDMLVEEYLAQGMSPEAADAQARRRFGGFERIRAEGVRIRRDTEQLKRRWDLLEDFVTDMRISLRGLRRDPTFATVAIVTLALGLGASAAVFSVVEAVLFEPLPFAEPDRVVHLYEDAPFDEVPWYTSPANLIDWRERNRVFTDIAAVDELREGAVNLTGVDEPLRIPVARVSANFFDILGVGAVRGRTFLPEDDAPGAEPVVVLSHGLWVQALGSDPDQLGRVIRVNGEPHTVVGVMPEGFAFRDRGEGNSARLWRAGALLVNPTSRRARLLRGVARLRPGVTLEQAQADMSAVALDLAEEYPETNSYQGDPWDVEVTTAHRRLVGSVRASLLLLSGAVGVVLLIGWVNVTNLLVARTSARRREFALRAAIGAGRGRVVRQLLTETLFLSMLGGAVGLGLARGLLAVFLAAAPASAGGLSQGLGAIPRLSGSEISGWVVAMTLLTCLVTTTACGLLPALHAVRGDPQKGLQAGGGRGHGRSVGGRLLVSLEVSLAMVLLIGSGLMVGTMHRISEIPLGFDPAGVQVLGAQLNLNTYSDAGEGNERRVRPERDALVTGAVQQLSALPTVESAAAVNSLPMRWYRPSSNVHIDGFDVANDESRRLSSGVPVHGRTDVVAVTPDYFRVLGIRRLEGRTFSSADDRSAPSVAIINQDLADQFGIENPLGRQIRVRDGVEWRSTEVVGVVGTTFRAYPDHRMAEVYTGSVPTVYLPYAQPAAVYTNGYAFGFQMSVQLIVRHAGDGEVVQSAMREIFRSADAENPITFVAGMEDIVTENLVDRRFHLLIISVLAPVSLILALIGVYGVMSFQVRQRVHEIGVRMALGAQGTGVIRMIVGEGFQLAVLGALMGIAGAMAGTRLLSNWLYGVSPTDPLVFVGLAGTMVAVAALACWIPANWAARVDPIETLKAE